MREDKHYEYHVFFCTNARESGMASCAALGAKEAYGHAKKCVKEQGVHGIGRVRINQAGCMGRCDEGPLMVVYPQGIWYTYIDNADVDEVVECHLVGGEAVNRLRV